MMNGRYHVSLACLGGHFIDNRIDENPEKKTKFCPTCGERTIYRCQNCHAFIRGEYESFGFNPNYWGEEEASVPYYCHECGKQYPWTTRYKEAFKKTADGLPHLRRKEKTELKQSIDDIIDNPTEAQLAVVTFNRLTAKAQKKGIELRELVITVVGGILGEVAKRAMFP